MHVNSWSARIILVLLFASMISCSREVHERDTVTLGGLLYEIGEDRPFSGTVMGKGREDYRKVAYAYVKEYRDGVQHGQTVFLYPNGKLESKATYINGQINGFFTRFWPNGKLKARMHFVDGLRGGLKGEMFWDENGRQMKE